MATLSSLDILSAICAAETGLLDPAVQLLTLAASSPARTRLSSERAKRKLMERDSDPSDDDLGLSYASKQSRGDRPSVLRYNIAGWISPRARLATHELHPTVSRPAPTTPLAMNMMQATSAFSPASLASAFGIPPLRALANPDLASSLSSAPTLTNSTAASQKSPFEEPQYYPQPHGSQPAMPFRSSEFPTSFASMSLALNPHHHVAWFSGMTPSTRALPAAGGHWGAQAFPAVSAVPALSSSDSYFSGIEEDAIPEEDEEDTASHDLSSTDDPNTPPTNRRLLKTTSLHGRHTSATVTLASNQEVTFADLITLAISATPGKRAKIHEIYRFAEMHASSKVPLPINWKLAIRHNLSSRTRFTKNNDGCTSRNSWWCLTDTTA